MSNSIQNGLAVGIKVIAYDFDTKKKVGEFESLEKAAKRLFIRRGDNIHYYLFGRGGRNAKSTKDGIADYKTGKKYHFELAQ